MGKFESIYQPQVTLQTLIEMLHTRKKFDINKILIQFSEYLKLHHNNLMFFIVLRICALDD